MVDPPQLLSSLLTLHCNMSTSENVSTSEKPSETVEKTHKSMGKSANIKPGSLVDRLNSYVNHSFVVLVLALFDKSGVFKTLAQSEEPMSTLEIVDKLQIKEVRILEDGLAACASAGFVQFVVEGEETEEKIVIKDEFARLAVRTNIKWFLNEEGKMALVDPSLEEMNRRLIVDGQVPPEFVAPPPLVVPWTQGILSFAGVVPKLSEAMLKGGGVKFVDYCGGVSNSLLRTRRVSMKTMLTQKFIPAMGNGIEDLLKRGCDVGDFGCGSGSSTIVMSLAYSKSKFRGYDLDDESIDNAKKDAQEMATARGVKLDNLTFKVASIYDLPEDGHLFDLIFCFDLIHDLPDVIKGLSAIKRSLKPGGIFVMMEPKVGTEPFAETLIPEMEMLYSISTLHCVSQSLAWNGAGMGACWGETAIRQTVKAAGFTSCELMEDVPFYQAFYKIQ